jgi:hypothetical protein
MPSAVAADYQPHVSLYYGPLTAAQRREAIAEVGAAQLLARVQRLELWRCRGLPHQWRQLEALALTNAE